MIKTNRSQHVTFAQAAKLLPNRPHINTVRRWAAKGVGGVRLPVIRIGRRVMIDVSDLEAFVQAFNDDREISLS